MGDATYDRHAHVRRCLACALRRRTFRTRLGQLRQALAPTADAAEGLEYDRQISAGGRGHRHHTRQAFDVIGASSMVPQHPSPLRGPRLPATRTRSLP